MRIFVFALLLLLRAGIAWAAPPHGLYAMWRPGVAISPVAQGVTINVPWSAVEPAAGVYDWSAIEAGFQAAGRRPVMIGVVPGVHTPDWLYASGAQSIAMTWTFRFAFPMCATVRLPVPWDPVYLAAWSKFVAALGVRYAGNPQVSAIKIAGINGKTIEQVLPLAVPVGCPNAIDPVSQWLSVGYRPALLTGAWSRVLTAYVAAFPSMPMVLQTGPWAMPRINAAGQVTRPDWMLTRVLMQQFVTALGPRAILENDGLGTIWTWHSPIAGVAIGTQSSSPVTGDRRCRAAGGHPPCDPVEVVRQMLVNSAGDVFAEFYPPDINNPALAGLFAARFPP